MTAPSAAAQRIFDAQRVDKGSKTAAAWSHAHQLVQYFTIHPLAEATPVKIAENDFGYIVELSQALCLPDGETLKVTGSMLDLLLDDLHQITQLFVMLDKASLKFAIRPFHLRCGCQVIAGVNECRASHGCQVPAVPPKTATAPQDTVVRYGFSPRLLLHEVEKAAQTPADKPATELAPADKPATELAPADKPATKLAPADKKRAPPADNLSTDLSTDLGEFTAVAIAPQ